MFNCNDEREMVDITIEAQKIISCIYRMRERFGIGMVAEVLKGSRKAKILELRFDELSTHGIMHEVPLQEIKDLINFLVAEDYLELSNGEYPVVKLLPNAVLVIKGEAKVTQKVSQQPSRELVVEVNLFDRLRALRRKIALRENLPPYMIFADSTLREMAQVFPADHMAMIRISGVGERKLEKYGEEFLEEIRSFIEENGVVKSLVNRPMPSDSSTRPQSVRNPTQNQANKIPSHHQTYLLYQEGYAIEDIAHVRNVTVLTVQDHIVRCSLDGQAVRWDDFIPIGQEALILQAVNQVGREKLRPIKELLSDEVEWFTIRAVLEKHREIAEKE
ncbi:ATP-dependent DNA helicase RecQ (fragment) [Candidatus Desulfosporosinus infrequens]|uniref:DNA 3'-5' helicase n=1 Tax=Candidatus Desulfosporosinus infrequens TaxID=2043169 RepID=A0A2U3LK94_9FIRM